MSEDPHHDEEQFMEYERSVLWFGPEDEDSSYDPADYGYDILDMLPNAGSAD